MRRTLIALTLVVLGWLAYAPVAEAVQVEVQLASCAGNDVACAFTNPTTSGNAVIAGAWVASTETITINNSTFTFTGVNTNPFIPSAATMTARLYLWCGIADGDNSYTFTTSSTGAAGVKMVEVTETSCTAEATGSFDGGGATTAAPSHALETTSEDTIIVSIARSSANRTWTAGTDFTLISTSGSTTLAGERGVFATSGSKTVAYSLSSSAGVAVFSAAFPRSGGGVGGGSGGPAVGSLSSMGAGR